MIGIEEVLLEKLKIRVLWERLHYFIVALPVTSIITLFTNELLRIGNNIEAQY